MIDWAFSLHFPMNLEKASRWLSRSCIYTFLLSAARCWTTWGARLLLPWCPDCLCGWVLLAFLQIFGDWWVRVCGGDGRCRWGSRGVWFRIPGWGRAWWSVCRDVVAPSRSSACSLTKPWSIYLFYKRLSSFGRNKRLILTGRVSNPITCIITVIDHSMGAVSEEKGNQLQSQHHRPIGQHSQIQSLL